MSDSTAVVLVIAALFAIESFAIVPEGATIFVSRWLRRFAVRSSGGLLRLARGRLLVLHPLVASSHHFATGIPALMLDGEGIADCGPEDVDARTRRPFVRWENLGRVSCDEKSIRAEGLGSIDCGSARVARLWARVLNAIRTAPHARRPELVRRWTRIRFSTALVRRRVERVQAACLWLEIFSDNFFFLLTAACAALLWLHQPSLVLPILVAGEIAGWVIALLFWRAHARLYPRARGERLGKAIVMALCFPVALRARSTLARDSIGFAHPAAGAVVLLTPVHGAAFLRRLALRWLHPLPIGEPVASATSAATIDAMKALAKNCEQKWSDLVAAPAKTDEALKTYCPRCQASYVLAAGTCADCPGIALVPLVGVERTKK